MRPRKKIWLRVGNPALRGEWRFILEDVWMYRVVSSQPEEFHMVLTSRDLKGNHSEIREKIKAHFAKRGPKKGFKYGLPKVVESLLAESRQGKGPASHGDGSEMLLEQSKAVRDGAAA